jgi:hypothetical protein
MPASFQLGRIVITPAALAEISPEDWGNVEAEDRQANDDALRGNDRLLSSYESARKIEFWILTDGIGL